MRAFPSTTGNPATRTSARITQRRCARVGCPIESIMPFDTKSTDFTVQGVNHGIGSIVVHLGAESPCVVHGELLRVRDPDGRAIVARTEREARGESLRRRTRRSLP